MTDIALDCSGLCQVIDRLELGIAVLDREHRIIHWNNWLARRSGLDSQAVAGQSLFFAFPEAVGSRLSGAIDYAIRDGLPSLLSPALHGTLLPLYQKPDDRRQQRRMQQLIHVLPIRDASARGACIVQISDVTANISRERLLRQQAENLKRSTTEDPLTGLANRHCFDEVLSSEFRRAHGQARPLTLMIADIDMFAQYNTRYGRDQGDAALVEVARIFRQAVRPGIDLVSRYSGEEFAFILPGIDAPEARRLAEKLRREVVARNLPNEASTIAPQLTVSIGLAEMIPDDQTETNTLISSADVALYQAKHEGRNRSVFFSVDSGQFITCC